VADRSEGVSRSWHADAVSALRKRHVEALLGDYDRDPVGALTVALRLVLDLPKAEWDELIEAAPVPRDRRDALLARRPEALDELVAELNEERRLRP
jgi:hypothetical protein